MKPLELVQLYANLGLLRKTKLLRGPKGRPRLGSRAPHPSRVGWFPAPAVVLPPTGPPCGHRGRKYGLPTPCRVAGRRRVKRL
jgi:hypothetical protein